MVAELQRLLVLAKVRFGMGLGQQVAQWLAFEGMA